MSGVRFRDCAVKFLFMFREVVRFPDEPPGGTCTRHPRRGFCCSAGVPCTGPPGGLVRKSCIFPTSPPGGPVYGTPAEVFVAGENNTTKKKKKEKESKNEHNPIIIIAKADNTDKAKHRQRGNERNDHRRHKLAKKTLWGTFGDPV